MAGTAIIIGAGPAGLTAAYELLKHTDIIPVIVEEANEVGGLSKTVMYKGNRMDIGVHRFFSKSDEVLNWWQHILPIEANGNDIAISYQNKQTVLHPSTKENRNEDDVMLVLPRQSRIYFEGNFFDYPVKLNKQTLQNLGLLRIAGIGISYIKSKVFPKKPEVTLEDFFINRFGGKLYLTFFKDYTEKVWGVPPAKIGAEWGAQRVKGLSLTSAIKHLLLNKSSHKKDIEQKHTETSLIEKFLYPKYGAGQMWQAVAKEIEKLGGKILLNHKIIKIHNKEDIIESITALNKNNKEEINISGDYFISSMPVKDIVAGFSSPLNTSAVKIAAQLMYRDFIIVGVLLSDLKLKNKDGSAIQDSWLYIQEKKVKIGRLQVYNNWSKAMISDEKNYWLGLEYFCNEGDEIWNLTNEQMTSLAINELVSINIINREDVLDITVLHAQKAYPSYIGAYSRFDELRHELDKIKNLFLVGRNGMHKYNNQDHSMLTAMQAVENIKNGMVDKENIWSINTGQEYHEEKTC